MLGSRVFHTSRPVRFAMATIAAVVGGAVLAGSALAVGPPGGMPAGVPAGVPGGAGAGGPTPQVLATQICAQLQGQMGAQFTTKFGTQAGCLKQATALATAQAARCQTAADPQTCVTQGITAAAATLASGGKPGHLGRHPRRHHDDADLHRSQGAARREVPLHDSGRLQGEGAANRAEAGNGGACEVHRALDHAGVFDQGHAGRVGAAAGRRWHEEELREERS